MLRTREQNRASGAYARVEAVAPHKREDYGRLAHKLPILIRQAGLAQALAFVMAKQKDGGLLSDLAASLKEAGLLNEADANALTRATREADLLTYQLLTSETLALLVWYKRYAQSVLGVASGEDDQA